MIFFHKKTTIRPKNDNKKHKFRCFSPDYLMITLRVFNTPEFGYSVVGYSKTSNRISELRNVISIFTFNEC